MLLPSSFFERDARDVAPALLGQELRQGSVVLRIVEVEAYPPGDSANHCRAGRTKRNEAMWGPAGHAYVYLCYGVHQMFNVVTNGVGEGAGVLVRGCEIIAGEGIVAQRRKGQRGPRSLAGPGKVGQALGVDPTWSGHCLWKAGPLELHRAAPPDLILSGPRIGIDFADGADRRAPWRFAVADSPGVSHPKALAAVSGALDGPTPLQKEPHDHDE